MKTLSAILLLLMLPVLGWAQAPIYRQFFTTNPAPIVDVVAGSNSTVQASTPAVNIRRFTVNGVTDTNMVGLLITNAFGGITATNVYGSNVIGTVSSATNATYVTTAILTNQLYGSNVVGSVAEASHSTNSDTATYVTTAVLTNQTYASNVISGGQIVVGGVETNQLDNGFLQLTGNKRRTTLSPILTNDTRDIELAGNMSAASWTATGSLQGTNVTLTDTLVANLGTPAANTYPMRYASDVITSRGTGDFVKWDGANWKTFENVIATANYTNYALNSWKALLNAQTPFGSVYAAYSPISVGQFAPWRGIDNSGGDWGITGNAFAEYGYFDTTTGTSGRRGAYGQVFTLGAGNVAACGGAYYFGNACSDAERYWAMMGTHGTYLTTTPGTGSGAYFIYDMFTNSVPADGTARTNNWICAVVKNGSPVYQDSNLTPSTSASTPDWLAVVHTTAAVLFYTNGALCWTYDTAAGIPSSTLSCGVVKITKTAGTTSRKMYETIPFQHIRRGTAITIP